MHPPLGRPEFRQRNDSMKQSIWGLVMATGKAEQISSEIETAFLYLNDRPVLAYSLAAFNQCPEIEGIVVVVSRERAESVLGMVKLFGFAKVKKIVVGGAKRARTTSSSSSYARKHASRLNSPSASGSGNVSTPIAGTWQRLVWATRWVPRTAS